MAGKDLRIESDSMGQVKVPADAYWGASTQRAIENFPANGLEFPPVFYRALGQIKSACASVNLKFGLLPPRIAKAVIRAADEVIQGRLNGQFRVDIFQTGSGTSTNMNANEVIATRANEMLTGKKNTKSPVHPNDHVNLGQSSNDVIPSAIHVASYILINETLMPSLENLAKEIKTKAARYGKTVKTGRTHMMDAVPVTLGQEMSGWAAQADYSVERIKAVLPRLSELAIGGTAVGTGINTPAAFGAKVCVELRKLTGIRFREARNHFQAQACQDAATELSGQLRTAATSFIKIANDLRLMNSGPISGFNEIRLKALQPGSSIMPGKVNPVLPEAARMLCAQIIGCDATIAASNSMGDFELNTMLPVIACNILLSISLLANASLLLTRAIEGFEANTEHMTEFLERNPVIATPLAPVIGYDKTAEAVKKAFKEKKPVKQVVVEMGLLEKKKAEELLRPDKMTRPAVGSKRGKKGGVK